tara:strand:- start:645 stop:866 length:222 start_codon:yes stop_codon:yes gene_type:complete
VLLDKRLSAGKSPVTRKVVLSAGLACPIETFLSDFVEIFDYLGKSAENWAFSDLGLLQFVANRRQKLNLYMDI